MPFRKAYIWKPRIWKLIYLKLFTLACPLQSLYVLLVIDTQCPDLKTIKPLLFNSWHLVSIVLQVHQLYEVATILFFFFKVFPSNLLTFFLRIFKEIIEKSSKIFFLYKIFFCTWLTVKLWTRKPVWQILLLSFLPSFPTFYVPLFIHSFPKWFHAILSSWRKK